MGSRKMFEMNDADFLYWACHKRMCSTQKGLSRDSVFESESRCEKPPPTVACANANNQRKRTNADIKNWEMVISERPVRYAIKYTSKKLCIKGSRPVYEI